ncbi:hypothetical protein C8Q74DRAFT_802182 [Fomes fomentarius]|nr:hypothetical protein C8Q74DRAFT_802182 [Fomes fomentarius]
MPGLSSCSLQGNGRPSERRVSVSSKWQQANNLLDLLVSLWDHSKPFHPLPHLHHVYWLGRHCFARVYTSTLSKGQRRSTGRAYGSPVRKVGHRGVSKSKKQR